MQMSLWNAIHLKRLLTDNRSGKAKQENLLDRADDCEHNAAAKVQLCNLLPYSFKYLLTAEQRKRLLAKPVAE